MFISSFKDKDDWFKFLKFNLVKPGKINEETFNSILKRESLGNTFIGNNVSIPHPLIYKGRNLEIIIFLTSEGLNWDGNNVNLILLLLVPKGETELWDKIFKKLYPIINNSAFIEKISSIKNPDELKKILVREVGKNV
ncbi:MAG: PTS sugar transporter subunit IIA [Tissierellia bacterium]|nr:PTS sugar transporter subunit IIA [Tissierellia bacterium]